ncbi:MAG: LytR C-terminal domain-containing protein [Acidimicrobiales bacterium]
MSTGGRHVAVGSSYGRSTSGAAVRGAGLLAIAVILGIVLLQAFDKGDPYRITASNANGVIPRTPVTGRPAGGPVVTVAPSTTVPLRPPSAVKVLVANSSGIAGAAKRVSDSLSPRGYNVLAPTNGTTSDEASTKVEFSAGFDAEARVLAASLGLADSAAIPLPTPAPVADTRGADIVVIVGRDLANVAASANAGSPSANTAPATSPPVTSRRTPVTTAPAVTRPTTATTAHAAGGVVPVSSSTTIKH